MTLTAPGEQSVSLIFKKDWTSDSWGNPLPFFSRKDANSPVSLIQLHDTEGSTILWDQNSVYYNYANGFDHGIMVIHNAVDEDHNDEIEPFIKQLTITMAGINIVLSSENVLFTSQYHQRFLIGHSSLAAPEEDLAIYTNYVDQVYILKLNGSNIVRTSYALKADIGSIVTQLEHTECMYHEFEEGPRYEVYYMDLRDSAVIWAQLVFPANRYNDIQTVINRPNKLIIQEQTMNDFNPGSKLIKKILSLHSNFVFEEGRGYEEALEAATGLVTIEMKPKRYGIGCRSPFNMVSELEIACPPHRHIRVRKPEECEEYGSYVINKKSFAQVNDERAASEMVVQYDKQLYGCPFIQTARDVFKPEIDLYDEDTLVETMTAGFVMWEDNGRHDFTYTASMSLAGCLRLAQTWDKMKEGIADGVPVKNIWGPHNYENCFIYEVTEMALLQEPYQILNQSGNNSIRWLATGYNQLYLFSLHVVDPYYSYCSLEARVAVIVSDQTIVGVRETPLLRISLGTFAALTVCILFATYFLYRRGHIHELALDLHHNYGEKTEEDNEQEAAEETTND
nr:cation channel sperm-associated auxiliary subunit epsilon-like [Lytechinus pictus]